MGKLTTHVLDTMSGTPAMGMKIELYRLGERRERIAEVRTNADGRCDEPLLTGDRMQVAEYELIFHVDEYFHEVVDTSEPPFLASVPVRFSIADVDRNYHVPLLTTPWSYTTYRGS